MKEFGNLKDAKEAYTVVKRSGLPAGCRVVPGKGMFTVKPDGSPFQKNAIRGVWQLCPHG